ncbi:hypothetical protein M8C21_019437, partial [Ambrosia artemisiifolia]
DDDKYEFKEPSKFMEPQTLMIGNFITDIREFSTSVSECNSPAAMIIILVTFLMLTGVCLQNGHNACMR